MKVLLLGFVIVFCSSCSWVLPYEEDTLCSRGKEGGYCGRVSDVYKKTLEEDGHVADYYELCSIDDRLCQ